MSKKVEIDRSLIRGQLRQKKVNNVSEDIGKLKSGKFPKGRVGG
jgi:hypothetical protein